MQSAIAEAVAPYAEADLLPLSGLQHIIFCERQCALIHLEQVWRENRLTAEGRVLPERVDTAPAEGRGDLRIARHRRSGETAGPRLEPPPADRPTHGAVSAGPASGARRRPTRCRCGERRRISVGDRSTKPHRCPAPRPARPGTRLAAAGKVPLLCLRLPAPSPGGWAGARGKNRAACAHPDSRAPAASGRSPGRVARASVHPPPPAPAVPTSAAGRCG